MNETSPVPHPDRKGLGLAIKWIILLSAAVLAVIVVFHGERYPRTDDASVTANIVAIAPRVTGPIIQVAVGDDQVVKAGDLLFVVDPIPYQDAVEKASAEVEQTEDTLRREKPLLEKGFATQEQIDEANTAVRTASAELHSARYDLLSCRVAAPVSGITSNVNLSIGNFAHAGTPVITMVDTENWYVIANFRESLLRHIRIGSKAKVYLMTRPSQPYAGEVVGIGPAVVPEEAPQASGIPNVARELNWVRLAQRYPVRVRLTINEEDTAVKAGVTAIVTIYPP